MNREIKFRLYNADEKIMHYKVGIEPLYFTLFEFMGGKMIPPKQVGYIGKDCDNIFIMQYTGLEDKDGTEIWEGDICLTYIDLGGDSKEEFKFIVEFEVGGFWGWREDLTPDTCTVIGNIYQNPELYAQH